MARTIEFDQLDAELDRADALMGSDYAAAIRLLNDVNLAIEPPGPIDPFSGDYAAWVMQTYRRIAGVDEYAPATHEADRNVHTDIALPDYFPYSTKDLAVIGRYLAGVGMILAELRVPRGSRIVEYGVGWGHVSTALARAGYAVTCVDIEAKFLRLAQLQAERLGCAVQVHHGAFGDTPFAGEGLRADAVIFSEAFHHAFEHLDVLRRLRENVLRPGGVLVLAAEPVHPEFPVPWGIRPDGHALWAVRRQKWMELGFQEDYLLRALLREGFLVSRTRIDALGPFGLLYRGQLHEGSVQPGNTLLPGTEAASWAAPAPEESRLWAGIDSRATLDQAPRWRTLAVDVVNYLPVPLTAAIDAGGAGPALRRRFEPGERATVEISLPPRHRTLRAWSETAIPAALGINDDHRLLGIAIEALHYHES